MPAKAAKTRISTRGNVSLPSSIRRPLNLKAGDALDVTIVGRQIVLTPKPKKKFKAKLVTDPRTGLPVISLGSGAPVLTSEMVKEMLADFP